MAEIVILQTDLDCLSPSSFRRWAQRQLSIGSGLLESVIIALVSSGAAKDKNEALLALNELCRNFPAEVKVASCDFTGKPSLYTIRLRDKLKTALSIKPEVNGKSQNWMLLPGMLAHRLMRHIISGKLLYSPSLTSFRNAVGFVSNLHLSGQGSLFQAEVEEIQRQVCPVKDSWLNSLLGIFNEICQALKSSQPENFKLKELSDWYLQLARFFGPEIIQIHKQDPSVGYYTLMTLASLISATVFYANNPKQLVGVETRILRPERNLGNWRIDGLIIESIKGKSLLRRQKVIAQQLGVSFSSLEELVTAATTFFGREICFNILDFKFAVGDGEGSIIEADQIRKSPLPNHDLQMRRYLVLASLISRWQGQGKNWLANEWFSLAELHYHLATSFCPTLHPVVLSSEEKTKLWHEQFASVLETSQERALNRGLTNFLLQTALKALDKKSLPVRSSRVYANGLLFSKEELARCNGSVHAIDRQPPKFVDKLGGVIQEIRTPRGLILKMHLDKLLEAINQGRVKLGHFNLNRGGFVGCLMPNHEDHHPSMYINLVRGLFKCFSCGTGGQFEEFSIPANFQVKMAPRVRLIGEGIPEIPEAHHHAMSLAQALLQMAFRGSPAERYVSKRKIDPDLAFNYGAGFGSDLLIAGLLDAGLTFEEIAYYGFLGFSEKIRPDSPLATMFKARGLGLAQIQKDNGLPYAALNNRVTFPLVLYSKVTNFYGRHVASEEKSIKHRKLLVDHTGVPQGLFNWQALEHEGPEPVIATEGAFDALALIQHQYQFICAVIGLDNWAIVQALARSKKNLAIALDNDEGGRQGTERLRGKLLEHGCKQHISDFTAVFRELHKGQQDALLDNEDWSSWHTRLSESSQKP